MADRTLVVGSQCLCSGTGVLFDVDEVGDATGFVLYCELCVAGSVRKRLDEDPALFRAIVAELSAKRRP